MDIPDGVGNHDTRGLKADVGAQVRLLVLEEGSDGREFTALRRLVVVVPRENGMETVMPAFGEHGEIHRSALHHALQGDERGEAVALLACQHTHGAHLLAAVDDVREVGHHRELAGGHVQLALDISGLGQGEVDTGQLKQLRGVPDVDGEVQFLISLHRASLRCRNERGQCLVQELLHSRRQAGVAELAVGVGLDEVTAEQ